MRVRGTVTKVSWRGGRRTAMIRAARDRHDGPPERKIMTYWAAWRAVAVVILMVASGACASTQEAGKPGVVAVDVTEFTSTVEAVDYQKRTIALRGAQGNVRTYKVGDSVQRLN